MPDALVPESPLSITNILDEAPELLSELDELVYELVDELAVAEGTNLTASAEVVLVLDAEKMTTFAFPEKV